MKLLRLNLFFILCGIFLIGGILWVWRVQLRFAYEYVRRTALPKEQLLEQPQTTSNEESRIKNQELAFKSFPKEMNHVVPFMLQAPHSDWGLPYQEACEEASALMASAFVFGTPTAWTKNEADLELLKLIEWEKKYFGFYEDTTVRQVEEIMRKYFNATSTYVVANPDAQFLREQIAQGRVVLAPAYGKALPNPYFRNGGPLYHMLIIKGYTERGFITNDPGVGVGKNFFYKDDALLNAIHDWNGGDVPHGERIVLVVGKD